MRAAGSSQAAAHNFSAAYRNLTCNGDRPVGFCRALERGAPVAPAALHDGPATGRMRDCLKIEHHVK
ncbi:protein of unknown function [Cupriavidus taiwanensis]|nr:protein of unknown function [Cupriavidus taiwanensis]